MSNQKNRKKNEKVAGSTSNRNPRGIYKGTREEWLTEAMSIMAVWLNTVLQAPCLNKLRTGPSIPKGHKKGDTLLSIGQKWAKFGKKGWQQFKFRMSEVAVSCSLLSAGMNHGPALAHAHLKHATGNNKHEIRMGVQLGGRKTKESSARIADILLHEMVHCMFPFHGHRKGFRDMCHSVGLNAPMTSTVPSPALQERIENEVVKVLGRYPHKAVKLIPRGQRGKGSRLLKAECLQCKAVVRMSRKVADQCLDNLGYASCVACEAPMEVHY